LFELSVRFTGCSANAAISHRLSLQRTHGSRLRGVELDSVEQAGAHALAAAPQMLNDLMPGEGWRLKIDLSLCLEKRDSASEALDTGALGELT
jgi:hypothetical protein